MKLSYLVFEIQNTEAWKSFGEHYGFQGFYESDALLMSHDDQERRFIFRHGPKNELTSIGFEIAGKNELHAEAEQLSKKALEVQWGTTDECEVRGVEAFFRIQDPVNDLTIEYAVNPRVAKEKFASALMPHGFVTGNLGMGHAAFYTKDIKATENFWLDVLGAKISDRIRTDSPVGPIPISFFRFNGRHHSIAFLETESNRKLNHFEVQAAAIEDLGILYDRVQKNEVPLGVTLGQHPNDKAISFYAMSPAGFMLECGFGPVEVTDDWPVGSYDRLSLWGHVPQRPGAL